jgi:hypothetical protein
LQQEKESAAAHANDGRSIPEGFLHETYQSFAICGPGGNVEKDQVKLVMQIASFGARVAVVGRFLYFGGGALGPTVYNIFDEANFVVIYVNFSERDRLLFFKSCVAGIFFRLDLSTLLQALSQELYSPLSSEKSIFSGYQSSHLYLNLAYYTMVLPLELLADSHAPRRRTRIPLTLTRVTLGHRHVVK